jgi:hypothetical protein
MPRLRLLRLGRCEKKKGRSDNALRPFDFEVVGRTILVSALTTGAMVLP